MSEVLRCSFLFIPGRHSRRAAVCPAKTSNGWNYQLKNFHGQNFYLGGRGPAV